LGKPTVQMELTLDGYMTGQTWAMNWFNLHPEAWRKRMATFTAPLGRRSDEGLAASWPS